MPRFSCGLLSMALAASSVTVASAQAATEAVVYSFKGGQDGEIPSALINVGGTLYGTTSGDDVLKFAGTVFKATRTGAEKVIYRFKETRGGNQPDGASPNSLINLNGTLYGTTQVGGTNYGGTFFRMSPTRAETVLYDFKGEGDGEEPFGPLLNLGGIFYGTTYAGGSGGFGTVFKVTTDGTETVIYSFKGGSDGAGPIAGLINVGGTLYGTTAGGGGCCGTVFKVTPTGVETVLYSFKSGNDGSQPAAGLIEFDGALYGATSSGGNQYRGHGTIFKITLEGVETVLYTFNGGSDGYGPDSNLTEFRGALYGTTFGGGGNSCSFGLGCGTVFSVTPTGVEKVIHSFGRGADGYGPATDLVRAGDLLYGTTQFGGQYGYGTVYQLAP